MLSGMHARLVSAERMSCGHACPRSTLASMNAGIHAREESGTRAGVFLNAEAFDQMTKTLGSDSDLARARLLSVDPKTIYRARRGVIGEEFIARVLGLMQLHRDTLAAAGIEPAFESVFKLDSKQVPA